MTRSDRDIIKYGIVGSLTVHLLLCFFSAFWINRYLLIVIPEVTKQPEPEVTMVYPDFIKEESPPQKKGSDQYIRTTQNDSAAAPPEKADFISDKNTVASAKNGPDPEGNVPLPSMKGIDLPTLELANRDYKEGQIKNDSAPSPPPIAATPSPPVMPKPEPVKPEMRPPDPEPLKQEVAKKETTSTEKMLQEASVGPPDKASDQPPEQVKPAQPAMRTPQDDPPVPKAVPVAKPLANTPNPEQDAFMPETRVSNVKGSIASRGGQDAVNAARTMAGVYDRAVQDAIGQRWHKDVNMKTIYMVPGKIGLRFFVGKDGTVRREDVTVIFDESGPMLKESALNAILKAKLPSIPKDLLPMLDKDRFEVNCHFIYR
jgi:hypothetical protein